MLVTPDNSHCYGYFQTFILDVVFYYLKMSVICWLIKEGMTIILPMTILSMTMLSMTISSMTILSRTIILPIKMNIYISKVHLFSVTESNSVFFHDMAIFARWVALTWFVSGTSVPVSNHMSGV